MDGRPVWNHTRGGIGGASAIAIDDHNVYVLDRVIRDRETLYRLDRVKGEYTTWQGRDTAELPLKELFENFQPSRDNRFGLAGNGGKLYLSAKLQDQIVVLDAATGAVLKRASVSKPWPSPCRRPARSTSSAKERRC